MAKTALTRRTILATGAAVLVTGASGLLVPARAKGLAPTRTMRGGANNYLPNAPMVERIGGGRFWMTGTVRRADDGCAAFRAANPGLGTRRPKGMNATLTATARPSRMQMVSSVWRCHKLFRPSARPMVISPMIVVISKPCSCVRSWTAPVTRRSMRISFFNPPDSDE